jgi:hypothetical protein
MNAVFFYQLHSLCPKNMMFFAFFGIENGYVGGYYRQ